MCVAVILACGVAAADPASDLAAARRHFDDLDYEQVLDLADRVVHDPAASKAQKVDALFLRGSALVVLDRDRETTEVFGALLTLEPDFSPAPDTPPRIRGAFESARAAWRVQVEEDLATRYGAQLRDVSLTVDAPSHAIGGRPLELHVRLVDPHKLASRIVLGYRRETDREYSLVSTAAAPEATLSIPGALLETDRELKLAWYVHAVHATGATLRREGDEANPRWLAISRGHVQVARGRSWWFWPTMAALVVSAVAVPILIDQARDVGPQHVVIGGS